MENAFGELAKPAYTALIPAPSQPSEALTRRLPLLRDA